MGLLYIICLPNTVSSETINNAFAGAQVLHTNNRSKL
uniref:Uncharacterized protein n=1 Tax=Anguilla anguilla TaxID=7936 RepID=A0A0E9S9Z3_ANGAN